MNTYILIFSAYCLISSSVGIYQMRNSIVFGPRAMVKYITIAPLFAPIFILAWVFKKFNPQLDDEDVSFELASISAFLLCILAAAMGIVFLTLF